MRDRYGDHEYLQVKKIVGTHMCMRSYTSSNFHDCDKADRTIQSGNHRTIWVGKSFRLEK